MSEPIPRHASVVVIGGGIMGLSKLHHLARMIQYSVDLHGRLEQETGQSVGRLD